MLPAKMINAFLVKGKTKLYFLLDFVVIICYKAQIIGLEKWLSGYAEDPSLVP